MFVFPPPREGFPPLRLPLAHAPRSSPTVLYVCCRCSPELSGHSSFLTAQLAVETLDGCRNGTLYRELYRFPRGRTYTIQRRIRWILINIFCSKTTEFLEHAFRSVLVSRVARGISDVRRGRNLTLDEMSSFARKSGCF